MVLAFKVEGSRQLAYVFNYSSKDVEELPAAQLVNKIGGAVPLADFVKARDLFQKKYLVKGNTEIKLAKKDLKKTDREKQKKERKTFKEEKATARRSSRLLEITTRPVDRKEKAQAPKKKRNPTPSAKTATQSLKRKLDDEEISESSTESKGLTKPVKSRPLNKRQKIDRATEHPSTPVIEHRDEVPLPEDTRPPSSSLNLECKNGDVVEATMARVEGQPSAFPSTNVVGVITLSEHEFHLARVREAFLRQTIANMQLNEMMTLTDPKLFIRKY